jgi:Ser/Thr protein kinase RdoA (MazF antagonist)
VAANSDPLYPLIGRAAAALARWLGSLPAWLLTWTAPKWHVQPCLCDVWHDHLLFTDDRLTGLVDYTSIKRDHVAVDLARMLGSLVADDDDGWRTTLAAHRSVRPLSAEEAALARALDRTGTVLGVANWLRWLYADAASSRKAPPSRSAWARWWRGSRTGNTDGARRFA